MSYSFECENKEVNLTLGRGIYLLNVFGAEGGSFEDPSKWGMAKQGGKGGFSSAVLEIKHSSTIYVNVGCKGEESPYNIWDPGYYTLLKGGFNGGGDVWSQCGGATGGGASDIRLNGNEFDDRIIIAGGGGGAAFSSCGGDGGGIIGGNATFRDDYNVVKSLGIGGSDMEGGKIMNYTYNEIITDTKYTNSEHQNSFGQKGSGGNGLGMFCGGAGGGGGYFGGGGCYNKCGGGGGSSYIKTFLKNRIMKQGVKSGNGLITIEKLYDYYFLTKRYRNYMNIQILIFIFIF